MVEFLLRRRRGISARRSGGIGQAGVSFSGNWWVGSGGMMPRIPEGAEEFREVPEGRVKGNGTTVTNRIGNSSRARLNSVGSW